jgi:hypothetical protein
MDPRAVLEAVVKRKIPSPRWESNPRTPIIQPVAQRYTAELSRRIPSYINYNFVHEILCYDMAQLFFLW